MRNFILKILREGLNEIDWKGDFPDVNDTCQPTEKVVEYLNKVLANAPKDGKDREGFDAKYPYVHSKSSFFDKGSSEVDVNEFINRITSKPNNVVNTGEKMLKSGGPNEFVYKTGVPAFRGLVYDIENQKFHYINTCPGAGACVKFCYARKGNFIRYAASYDLMTKRLNLLFNNPNEYEEMMHRDLVKYAKEHKALEGYKAKVILRWNDSGDFFAKKYIEIAERVMSRLQDEGYNVMSYAYTKIGDLANSDTTFDTTFSMGALGSEEAKIAQEKMKVAKVIPSELANGLDLMRIDDEKEYKNRVAELFSLPPNILLTYEELMQTAKGKKPKWVVIVTNDDGDDAAFRKDVKNVLLKYH